MADEKPDRRVGRTRRLLRSALVQLVREKGYDAVTIQDIADRADVGRTTFYLHYTSKEDLLLDHHDADMSARFKLSIFTRDELLGDSPQPELIEYLELLLENRSMYLALRATRGAAHILRGVREQLKANLQNSLTAIFPDAQPHIPMDALTEYLVGAQESLIQWWLSSRNPYDARQLATMLHQLQRGIICDAYPSVDRVSPSQ
jgi:AcrR family transcriptional regulator